MNTSPTEKSRTKSKPLWAGFEPGIIEFGSVQAGAERFCKIRTDLPESERKVHASNRMQGSREMKCTAKCNRDVERGKAVSYYASGSRNFCLPNPEGGTAASASECARSEIPDVRIKITFMR